MKNASVKLLLVAALSVSAMSVACMPPSNPPPNLELSTTRTSEAGKYVVQISPPAQRVRVNQIQTWRIVLRTAAGEPVQGATIEVGGGMPEHGHGFPTQPRVSPTSEPGHYLLEGVKFSMTGWWEIKLKVQSPLGADGVTFNTVLPAASSS